MTTDDIFDRLPTDSEQAFVALEAHYRERLDTALMNDFPDHNLSYRYIDYISDVLGSARSLELEILTDWTLPTNSKEAAELFDAFSAEVRFHITDFKIKNGFQRGRYSVSLGQTDKEKIRHHIDQIRKIVENSTLTEDKKDNINNIIDQLSNEISRNRTQFEAIMDKLRIIADVTEEIEPKLLSPVMRILRVINRAKTEEDSARSLPKPREAKRLEPPRGERNDRSKPKQNSDDPDDEIPF